MPDDYDDYDNYDGYEDDGDQVNDIVNQAMDQGRIEREEEQRKRANKRTHKPKPQAPKGPVDDGLRAQLAAAKRENQSLKQQLKGFKDASATLKSSNATLSKQYQAQSKKIKSLESGNKGQQTTINDQKKALDKRAKSIKSLASTVGDQKKELKSLNSDLNKAKADYRKLEDQAFELEKENKALKDQVTDADKTIKDQGSTIEGLSQDIQAVQQENASLHDRVRAMSAQAQAKDGLIASQAAQIDALRARLAEAEAQAAQAQQQAPKVTMPAPTRVVPKSTNSSAEVFEIKGQGPAREIDKEALAQNSGMTISEAKNGQSYFAKNKKTGHLSKVAKDGSSMKCAGPFGEAEAKLAAAALGTEKPITMRSATSQLANAVKNTFKVGFKLHQDSVNEIANNPEQKEAFVKALKEIKSTGGDNIDQKISDYAAGNQSVLKEVGISASASTGGELTVPTGGRSTGAAAAADGSSMRGPDQSGHTLG